MSKIRRNLRFRASAAGEFSALRSWMPQTSASLDERKKVLETLTKLFPDLAWQICVEQFEARTRIGDHSYRPRWRSDASGAGQPVTVREHNEFVRKALDLALAWPDHNENTFRIHSTL